MLDSKKKEDDNLRERKLLQLKKANQGEDTTSKAADKEINIA